MPGTMRKTGKVELCVATLKLVQSGEQTKAPPQTQYQQNGIDVQRMKKALAKRGCCTSDCCKNVALKDLQDICSLWWALGEQQKQQYLCMQHDPDCPIDGSAYTDEQNLQTRTDWFIGDHRVCWTAFCSLLGTGKNAIRKKLKKSVDMRKTWGAGWRPGRRTAMNRVDLFFTELYHNQCEDLPEHLHMEDVDEVLVKGEMPEGLDKVYNWTPEACLSEQAAMFTGPDVSAPVRHLPPGKPMLLFWQFKAWWHAVEDALGRPSWQGAEYPTPSWSTFYRGWTQKWSNIMTFRKKSQHKECDTCFDLKQKLAMKGPSYQQKMRWAQEFQEHNRAQYHDRLIYWSLRFASRIYANILVIIIDSFDKVKTKWPQYQHHRKPAYLEKHIRPRTVLSAVMCHGWATCIFLTPETIHHGAAHYCDLICRSLDVVSERAKKLGKPMPQHLVVQADNTTAQSKNSLASVFLAYLVAVGKFLTATANFLTVGHTHEDVDRLFAMILARVLSRHKFEVPGDFAKLIKQELLSFVCARNEELAVQIVSEIHDFEDWLAPLGISLSNCFMTRYGKLSAHSFTYKIRADLTPKEAEAVIKKRRRTGILEHPEDVFCLTKGRMYMTSVKPPVLVIPHQRLSEVQGRSPSNMRSKHDLDDSEKDQLQKLASALSSVPGQPYNRAVAEIDRMVCPAGRVPPPPKVWLEEEAPPRTAVIHSKSQYYEHLPDTSWNLVASFRRGKLNSPG